MGASLGDLPFASACDTFWAPLTAKQGSNFWSEIFVNALKQKQLLSEQRRLKGQKRADSRGHAVALLHAACNWLCCHRSCFARRLTTLTCKRSFVYTLDPDLPQLSHHRRCLAQHGCSTRQGCLVPKPEASMLSVDYKLDTKPQ